MRKYLTATKEQFTGFVNLPVEGSIQMLNFLKFKKTVEETGISGEAQYKKYMHAATPFIQKSNAKILFYGEAQHTIIGPDGELEWDKILIVEYPSKNDFMAMVTDKDYPSNMRTLALEDSRLIFCSTSQSK